MLNPWMLLGLLGLSVPIIIHLIQRQRLRPQPLATLRFLDREDVANAFAPVPRDVLQLLLRLLLLALFVLGMARLVVGGSAVGPRTMAVILDQSLSMQQSVQGQPLFDRYQARILELIRGLGPRDKMALFLVGDTIAAETGYLHDRAQLESELAKFKVSDGGGLALLPAIRSAVTRLRSRHEVNACVIVFSDQQHRNFERALAETGAKVTTSPTLAFRRDLEESQVRVLLVDEGGKPGANLAVAAAAFTPASVYLGSSARATAEIHNWGAEAATAEVTFREGDKAGERRTCQVQPDETVQLDLVQRFESTRDRPCEVGLGDDVLPGDNHFYLPMRMKGQARVLIVSRGREGGETEGGMELSYRGADLLLYALNPGEALGRSAGTHIRVEQTTPALFERVSLPLYATIVLYGVESLPAQGVKDLLVFTENGGGLYLVPEPGMSPRRFNESFGPLLAGFAVGQLKTPDEGLALNRNEAELVHPLLLPLVREEWGQLRDLVFNEYFAVEAKGQAAPALVAANGDWLGVVVAHGRGALYVQLFSNELSASTLPRSTCFVPMIQQITEQLRHREERQGPEMLRVGEVLRLRVPELRSLGGNAEVSGPEKREFPVGGADGDTIRVSNLSRAGSYLVQPATRADQPKRAAGREHWVGVNPVLGESQLTALTVEEQGRLFGTRNVTQVPSAQVEAQFARRHELATLLLALIVLAFVVEGVTGAWQSWRRQRDQRAANGEGKA